jgi:UDP-N-acetylmuramate--alanine ligase
MIKDFTQKYQKIHFIGIGGRGLSALAQMLHKNGAKVSGSDLSTQNNVQLLPKDIQVFENQTPENINQIQPNIVIHSYAITDDNLELKHAKDQNIPTLTYPQALGEITKGYKLISIAGSHGKTTTTGMLIHIFQSLKIPFNAIIGTTTKILNNTNYHFQKDAKYFLLESCEYREAFLNYQPHSAIITNIEIDHFDFFKSEAQYLESYQKFLKNIQHNLILNTDFPETKKLQIPNKLKTVLYSQNDPSIELQVPGKHNRTNANGAIQLCNTLGFNPKETLNAIKNFPGVDRRQELIQQNKNQSFFDDNAHTPTEIKATLNAFKEKYPNQKICIVWQPQGYIRILKETQEFIDAVNDADKIILTDILNSRDDQETINQMPTSKFADLLNKKYQNTTYTGSIENTKQQLSKLTKNFPIVILIGGHHDIKRVL